MILESDQERLMLEETIDVVLKFAGKGALNVANYFSLQIKKYDEAKQKQEPVKVESNAQNN